MDVDKIDTFLQKINSEERRYILEKMQQRNIVVLITTMENDKFTISIDKYKSIHNLKSMIKKKILKSNINLFKYGEENKLVKGSLHENGIINKTILYMLIDSSIYNKWKDVDKINKNETPIYTHKMNQIMGTNIFGYVTYVTLSKDFSTIACSIKSYLIIWDIINDIVVCKRDPFYLNGNLIDFIELTNNGSIAITYQKTENTSHTSPSPTCPLNSIIHILDLSDGKICIKDTLCMELYNRKIALSPDNTMLVLCSQDYNSSVYIYYNNMDTKMLNYKHKIMHIKINNASIITISEDNKLIIIGYTTGDIYIWSLLENEMNCIQKINELNNKITSLVLSLDNTILVAGYNNGVINVWNLDDNIYNIVTSFKVLHYINGIAISSDNSMIVSLTHHCICIWNLENYLEECVTIPCDIQKPRWAKNIRFSEDNTKIVVCFTTIVIIYNLL
jgi:WD40 repeat protein